MPLSRAVETTQPPLCDASATAAAPMQAPPSPAYWAGVLRAASRGQLATGCVPTLSAFHRDLERCVLDAASLRRAGRRKCRAGRHRDDPLCLRPMGASGRAAGGILHGTGIIRDGELRFQNSDGSQFAFSAALRRSCRPPCTPKGQTYQAAFKKTP